MARSRARNSISFQTIGTHLGAPVYAAFKKYADRDYLIWILPALSPSREIGWVVNVRYLDPGYLAARDYRTHVILEIDEAMEVAGNVIKNRLV